MSSFTQDGAMQGDNSEFTSSVDGWSQGGDLKRSLNSANQGLMGNSDEAIDIRLAVLARAIEHEIIPRLMLAHRETHECISVAKSPNQNVSRKDVEEFAKLVLAIQEDHAQASLDAMLLRGLTVETIYLELLAPVARYMGELWEQDLCDFSEVTIGLSRLHKILRNLSSDFAHFSGASASDRRILLMPAPGEQHTFGLVMVSEFFRRAGWDVAGGATDIDADAAVFARREWFDVVGFSVGAEKHIDDLKASIDAIRKTSLNKHIAIMVGGPIFNIHPEFVNLLGADCIANDGKQATLIAEEIVKSKKLASNGLPLQKPESI